MASVKTSKKDVKKLARPSKKSKKGQNGTLLAIAGSKKWHGAAVFACVTASRLLDAVYAATSKENIPLLKKASPSLIVSGFSGIKTLLGYVNAVLAGPGLEKNTSNRKILKFVLSRKKKTVLDATALRLISPNWLHPNCIVTPHSQEFRRLFQMPPSKGNCKKAAKKYNCVVVLKGPVDFISDGSKVIENHTGNQGMTKGGTGDILAGLIAGFAAKNDLLLSAKAGCYLNGYAAGMLQKEKGRMWNSKDLMDRLPSALKKLEK